MGCSTDTKLTTRPPSKEHKCITTTTTTAPAQWPQTNFSHPPLPLPLLPPPPHSSSSSSSHLQILTSPPWISQTSGRTASSWARTPLPLTSMCSTASTLGLTPVQTPCSTTWVAAALPAAPLQTPSLTIGAAVPPPSLSHASCRCLRLSPRHRTLQMLPPTAPRPPPLLLRRGFCNDSSSRASPGGRVQSLLPASAVVAVVSQRRRSASCATSSSKTSTSAMHSSSSSCTICEGRQTSFKTSSTQSSRSMVDFQPRRTKDTLPSNLPRPNPLHTVVLFASFFFFFFPCYVLCVVLWLAPP